MRKKTLVKGAEIFTAAGLRKADLLAEGGKVACISDRIEPGQDMDVVEAVVISANLSSKNLSSLTAKSPY